MGGRCLGGEGSNEVEDVRVEKEWDGRCQGGEGSNRVEDEDAKSEPGQQLTFCLISPSSSALTFSSVSADSWKLVTHWWPEWSARVDCKVDTYTLHSGHTPHTMDTDTPHTVHTHLTQCTHTSQCTHTLHTEQTHLTQCIHTSHSVHTHLSVHTPHTVTMYGEKE